MENKLNQLSHVSSSRLRHRPSVAHATVKVRLAKRQRQHSIPPLNLEELKEEKAVQLAAEVTNRFMTSEAAQDEVNPEDLSLERYQDSLAGSGQRNDWICEVAKEKEMDIR